MSIARLAPPAAPQRTPQAVLQDLARRRGRQGVEHDDFARPLVGRQMRAGVRHQLVDGGGDARQQLHVGHDLLVGVDGAADHGRLHDRRVRIQDRFDLGRIDVEARADDQLLGAADDEQASPSKRARSPVLNQPSLSIAAAVAIRRAVVAAHHVGAAHMQLADLAVRRPARRRRPISAPRCRAGSCRPSCRARRIGAHAGNARRAFGDAVAIEQRLAELLLDMAFRSDRAARRRRRGRAAPAGERLRPAMALYSSSR